MSRKIAQNENIETEMEKRMGCMTGFFHILNRQQTKRLTGKTQITALPVSSPKTSTEIDIPSPKSPPLPLPIFEPKHATRSSPKVCKESPRLSLDSRTKVLEKSPSQSLIAKLMGLEPLGHDNKSQLMRSASESRVSRELFTDIVTSNVAKNKESESPRLWSSPHKKTFFDTGDVFPERKETISVYKEIERKLKMRGIDEPSKDLETLKQILEALKLKGLLHSDKNHRNFVIDRDNDNAFDRSSIVVIKPFRSMTPAPSASKSRISGGIDQTLTRTRNLSSPTRNEMRSCNSNSVVKRKPLNIHTNKRISPINSPKSSTNGIMRNKKSIAKDKVTVREEESSSISEVSASTSSQTGTERWKIEEYKEGRSLLERCDKLINSIAEMTANELQPSPVSVLDYKDESLSPSPVMKRSIHFQGELEEEIWSAPVSPTESTFKENSNDIDFMYISDIVRASHYLPEDSNIFLLLEKQQYLKGKDTSKCSTLQRKLIFETITEIIQRNKLLPPWKYWGDKRSSLDQIWSEFQRLRDLDTTDDLFEIVCGLLKKDFAGDAVNGWGDCHVEMSEAVLYIERLIFKDLVAETIRDLANFARKNTVVAPRRKLVF